MIFLKFSRFVGSPGSDLLLNSENLDGSKVSCGILNLPSDSRDVLLLERC